FVPIEEQILAEIGQPYTYSYRLAPETGLLRILTSPSDARIFVDDRVVGVGSYADRLPVGQHTVAVEAPDRPTERRTVMVQSQNERRLYVEMGPPRPPNGKIELLLGSTAIGLVEGGFLASAFVAEDEKPLIVLSSAAFGAAGFIVPYLLLPGEVRVSQSSL